MIKETLVEQIYDALHEGIISLKLKPGQRLHIADLAKIYKVGPGPIREALCRLLASELVIALPQRGFRVAPISKADLHDIYQTRAHIEATALTLSIQKGDDIWESEMISAYHRLQKFELEQSISNFANYKEWESRHRAFNISLLKACHLAHLLTIQERMYHLTERYRRRWLEVAIKNGSHIPYAKEQKRIMDAALSKNIDLATTLLHKHYEHAVKIIEKSLSTDKFFTSPSQMLTER